MLSEELSLHVKTGACVVLCVVRRHYKRRACSRLWYGVRCAPDTASLNAVTALWLLRLTATLLLKWFKCSARLAYCASMRAHGSVRWPKLIGWPAQVVVSRLSLRRAIGFCHATVRATAFKRNFPLVLDEGSVHGSRLRRSPGSPRIFCSWFFHPAVLSLPRTFHCATVVSREHGYQIREGRRHANAGATFCGYTKQGFFGIAPSVNSRGR